MFFFFQSYADERHDNVHVETQMSRTLSAIQYVWLIRGNYMHMYNTSTTCDGCYRRRVGQNDAWTLVGYRRRRRRLRCRRRADDIVADDARVGVNAGKS